MIDYLESLYSSDPESCEVFHGQRGLTPRQIAEEAWDNIKTLEIHVYDFGYIAVNRFDLLDRLGGFFIKKEYRNKEDVSRFYNELRRLLPKTFITFLHSDDKRAIEFLKKANGVVTKSDNITTCIMFKEIE